MIATEKNSKSVTTPKCIGLSALAVVVTLLLVYYFLSKSIPTSSVVQTINTVLDSYKEPTPETITFDEEEFEDEECNAACGIAGEGGAIRLDCGNKIIKEVLFASYGVPEGLCIRNDFKIDTTCHSPNSKTFVESQCLNKPKCEIRGNNQALGGDPCDGRMKWFKVLVKCE